ncbi:MAG: hypothetical protein PHP42_03225 [Bacteroidota bacterium]|nr:hypothetical protein [Bacteroidota bacterium]
MKRILFLFLLCTVLFLAADCKHEPPTKEKPPKPDSTSQEFEITTQELGVNGPTSFLKDVWIFSPQNIWAVGDVYMPLDSQGLTYKEYNIVQGNGSKWEGKGRFFNSNGIESIWALDSGTIYLADGLVIRYKNGEFTRFDFTQMLFENGQSIDKIWGTSEQNIWGAGRNGMVVHYDGSQWRKVDFPLGWNFRSITGSKMTGIAYATAESLGIYAVLRLSIDSISFLYHGNRLTTYDLQNLKMLNENELWFTGNPIRRYQLAKKIFQELYEETNGYFTQVMGVASEYDVYFWGDDFSNQRLTHYNGKRFTQIVLPYRGYVFEFGAYAITNLALMVAQSDNKAYIVTVKRKQ